MLIVVDIKLRSCRHCIIYCRDAIWYPRNASPPDRAEQKQQNIITFLEPSMSMNYTGHVNNSKHTMTMQSAKSRDPAIPAPEDTVQVARGEIASVVSPSQELCELKFCLAG